MHQGPSDHCRSFSYVASSSIGYVKTTSALATLSRMRSTPAIDEQLRARLIEAVQKLDDGSADAFGRRLGYTNGGYIREVLNGKKPVREALIARANATKELAGWFSSVLAKLPDSVSNVHEVVPRKRVPVVSWVMAGELEEVWDHHNPGEADEWVDVCHTTPGENAFALRVKNDSMTSPHPGERSFPEGTVITVDPMRGANAGDFVVAKDVATQKATFKKLITDGGRWFLKPLNPAYPTIEIDDPALRVIGRVIESVTRQKL